MKKLLISKIVLLFGMVLTSCTEEIAESNSKNISSKLIITVRDANTRAAYSGYTTTFEAGDRIGLYVVDGSSVVNANVLYEFDGTSWSTSADVKYSSRYTYYAYYPYVASPYTPDFTQAAIDDKFDLFINDASNKFHRTDQSTKANFQASDFMLAQGVAGGGGAVSFAMHHKKGLAVFNGFSAAEATFTGNIPYLMGSTKYFLMKPGTPTEFTDDDDTYTLYASSGKYKTHRIAWKYIDLGLPSGLLWASCNLGAENPWEYGLYYRWGDTEGRAYGNNSSWSGTDYSSTPGGQLGNQTLPVNSTYDAARKMLGEPWRMPTKNEWMEVANNTTTEIVTNYKGTGVKVVVITSRINGNELILPMNGRFWSNTSMNNVGELAFLWSSSPSQSNGTTYAVKIGATSSGSINSATDYVRSYWFGIRPVCSIRP